MHEGDNFIASMELYERGNKIMATIRLQGESEPSEIEVPGHMSAMLPQAVAMIKAQANG